MSILNKMRRHKNVYHRRSACNHLAFESEECPRRKNELQISEPQVTHLKLKDSSTDFYLLIQINFFQIYIVALNES